MSTEEQARRLMVEDRQHNQHINDNMVTRAVEEVDNLEITETAEKSRELLAQERKQEENLQENMLTRSSEEIE